MIRKNIPLIIVLIAGIITCIISIIKQYEINYFITLLIIVLLIFYTIGVLAKVLLDKILLEKEEPLEELEVIEEFEENTIHSDEID